MIGLIIAGCFTFLILGTVGWIIGFYNTIINAKQDIKNMFSNVLTEYKRRVDLLMNLVETVKGVARFEKSTLKEVINARNTTLDPKDIKDSMSKLKGLDAIFSKLNVVFERYPVLKSTEAYTKLMDEIRITEDRINVGRTDYNAIVRDYNTYISEFPGNTLARLFNFSVEVFFDIDKKDYSAPKIDLTL